MAPDKHSNVPKDGAKITVEKGALQVPEQPVIPYIEGDGIGPDIWCATKVSTSGFGESIIAHMGS